MPLSVMSKAVESPPAALIQLTVRWRCASWLGLGVPSHSYASASQYSPAGAGEAEAGQAGRQGG